MVSGYWLVDIGLYSHIAADAYSLLESDLTIKGLT